MKRLIYFIPIVCSLIACTQDVKDDPLLVDEEPIIHREYGYALNDFNVVLDTIQSGDTFGDILDSYGVPNQKILEVASKFRDSFDYA